MDKFVLIILIIVILIIFYYASEKIFFKIKGTYVKSENTTYLVKNTKNKYKKVEILNKLFEDIDYILENFKLDGYDIEEVRKKIKEMEIIENLTEEDSSYTINKGERMVICLANRETDKIYDYNLTLYVILHEVSHMICKSYGHGDEFKMIFNKLCKKAIDLGIYKYTDYKKKPEEYCGLILNTSIV
jgi:predicted metal-dependent hydrolase